MKNIKENQKRLRNQSRINNLANYVSNLVQGYGLSVRGVARALALSLSNDKLARLIRDLEDYLDE